MTITTLFTSAIIVMVPTGFTMPEVGIKCGGNIGGLYVERSDTIYVCESGVNTDFYKYHELGHHFWYKHLTKEQQEEYTKVWGESKYFFRDYGKTSAIEDFAENFSVIATKAKAPKIQKRLYLIKKYLRDTK